MPSHPDRVRRNYPRPAEPIMTFPDGTKLYVSKGKSCGGFITEDGMMKETVWDEDGNVIETRETPFREWNRI